MIRCHCPAIIIFAVSIYTTPSGTIMPGTRAAYNRNTKADSTRAIGIATILVESLCRYFMLPVRASAAPMAGIFHYVRSIGNVFASYVCGFPVITLAGIPTAVTLAGISWITTPPAPTILHLPILLPTMATAPAPSNAPSPTVTSPDKHDPGPI